MKNYRKITYIKSSKSYKLLALKLTFILTLSPGAISPLLLSGYSISVILN